MSRLIEQLDMTLTILSHKASAQKILVSTASAEHLFEKYEFISEKAKINSEK